MVEHPPTLDIVIVNWNAGRRLRDCLESIAKAGLSRIRLSRVVVVDNGSRDDSTEGLVGLQLPLRIIRNPVNRGFAVGCNQGVAGSQADYVLFLNPDTVLTERSLQRPIEFMEEPENHRFGICGIQMIEDSGRVARSCARFPRARDFITTALGLDRIAPRRFPSYLMVDWDHQRTMPVDHVIGAFYLIRRPIFSELQGFDERFFVYLEDLDLSLRARQRGWLSIYLADVQAGHHGGGTSSQIPARRLFLALRSRLLYSFKHFRFSEATAVMFVTLLAEPFIRLGLAILERSLSRTRVTVAAFARLWLDVPFIVGRALNADRFATGR